MLSKFQASDHFLTEPTISTHRLDKYVNNYMFLVWDHSKLSKFKFTWWDVTTLMPYIEETSFESSLMSARSGALQLSSLKSVHQSLTSNAKGIFNIIIEYQLENQKQKHYAGQFNFLFYYFKKNAVSPLWPQRATLFTSRSPSYLF